MIVDVQVVNWAVNLCRQKSRSSITPPSSQVTNPKTVSYPPTFISFLQGYILWSSSKIFPSAPPLEFVWNSSRCYRIFSSCCYRIFFWHKGLYQTRKQNKDNTFPLFNNISINGTSNFNNSYALKVTGHSKIESFCRVSTISKRLFLYNMYL